MDTIWTLRIALLLVLTSLGGTTGLTCHSCYRQGSHTLCNGETVQCNADQNEDGCYTEAERYDHFGKRYTKGCKNFAECQIIASLNHDCFRSPADCVYCCQGDGCNEFSASVDITQRIVGFVLPVAIMTIWII